MQENLFFEVIDGEPQQGQVDFDRCRNHTAQLVLNTIHKYNPHNRDLKTDVAWDCFTYLYMEGIFHQYDATLAKQRTLLYAGVRNYLIDKERSECRKIRPISENSTNHEEFSFFDIVDDKVSERIADISRYLDMLDSVQEELEAIEFSEYGKTTIVEGLGEMKFTAYTVMYLRMIGYNLVEIAELYGVSSSYTRTVYKKAADLIRAIFNTEEMLNMDDSDVKESKIHELYITVSEEELEGTPVLGIRPTHRRKFVLLCKMLEEGKSVKEIWQTLEIGDATASEWKAKYKKYFEHEMDAADIINRWLMVVK